MTQAAPAAMPAKEINEHVMNEAGEFVVQDEPINLSVYHFEDWLAFVFFWVLAVTIFYQFFTRYVMNDSASWTEEIARYLLATANIRIGLGRVAIRTSV